MKSMQWKIYKLTPLKYHLGFTVEEAGLFVHPDMPFIGASPVSVINYECCSKGVLEVKCLFSTKDGLPNNENKSFCMAMKEEKWCLSGTINITTKSRHS